MVELRIEKLDSSDAELRYNVVEYATKVLTDLDLELQSFTDEEVADFVCEWRVVGKNINDSARSLLKVEILEGEKVLDWVWRNYKFERLYALANFYTYCEWLNPQEIVRHFGDLLKLFMSLQGPTPSWCYVPFHVLLSQAFKYFYRLYRKEKIDEYLENNWNEATMLFENDEGVPSEEFEAVPEAKYVHFYSRYREVQRKKTRAYLKAHPEVVKRVKAKYKEL